MLRLIKAVVKLHPLRRAVPAPQIRRPAADGRRGGLHSLVATPPGRPRGDIPPRETTRHSSTCSR